MTGRKRLGISGLVVAGLAVAALAAVFLLYTRPDFMVQMANQVWACF
jgi:hypothetical protein